MFEALGRGFTLLAFGAKETAVQAFQAAAARLQLPLTVVEAPVSGEAACYGASLVLVCPGEFVAWASPQPDVSEPEAAAILQHACGLQPAQSAQGD